MYNSTVSYLYPADYDAPKWIVLHGRYDRGCGRCHRRSFQVILSESALSLFQGSPSNWRSLFCCANVWKKCMEKVYEKVYEKTPARMAGACVF
jgi:hypothetical protein